MANKPFTSENKTKMILSVRKSMNVFDVNGEKVGVVQFVRFGDEDLNDPGVETQSVSPDPDEDQTLIGWMNDVFAKEEGLPEETRARFLRFGYIRIDTGIIGADRYVEADHVASVDGEDVHLSVSKESLPKR